MLISGFTMVRNATILDFPLEASIRSLLPAVDELVVNVGASDDNTLDRVKAIEDPRIRILETVWNPSLGPGMLVAETDTARKACKHAWGIYIQADEVFADGAAERVKRVIEEVDASPQIEGVLVDYVHFYGGFDTIASNRSWYRREARAIRLNHTPDIHSFRDAQGFRVGPENRRIHVVNSGAKMHHYGWARPAWALSAKRNQDLAIYPWRNAQDPDRPLLTWIPGIRKFAGSHPTVVKEWIEARQNEGELIAPRKFEGHHLGLLTSSMIESLTGWRAFEYKNYVISD